MREKKEKITQLNKKEGQKQLFKMNSGTYTDKSCYLYTTGMEREGKGGERGGPGVGGEELGRGGKGEMEDWERG